MKSALPRLAIGVAALLMATLVALAFPPPSIQVRPPPRRPPDGVVVYRCDTCHAAIQGYGYAVGGKHYCPDCQYAAAPSPYVCPFPFRCDRCGIPLPVPGYCEECWRIKTHTDDFGYVLRTCPRCQRRFRDYDPPNTSPLCPSCLATPPSAE